MTLVSRLLRPAAAAGGATQGDPGAGSERGTLSDRLPVPWLFPLLVFGATWLLIIVTWNVANAIYHLPLGWEAYFFFKDGAIYRTIAENGYAIPPGSHLPAGALPPNLAFFPLLPLLVRGVASLTGHNYSLAGLIVQVPSGAAAAVAVWALAARVRDRWVADRTVILLCAFPGAMTFGMLYTEPLGIALVAASLLAAFNGRWLLAGIAGMFATAEHSTLIVVVPVLAVAAAQAIWARREWRSLLAPVIAALGYAAYTVRMGSRYHDYLFLPHVMTTFWHHRIDWGVHQFHVLTWTDPGTARHPFFNVMFIICAVLPLIGIALMIAARVPLPLTVFTALVYVTLIISFGAGPRPRYDWPAFGVFIGAAAMLPRWLYWPLFVVFAGSLAFLTGWWVHHGWSAAP